MTHQTLPFQGSGEASAGGSGPEGFLQVFPAAAPPHWRTDDQLKDIRLEAFDLITFDVFDTLLMRRLHRPDEVFLLLGQRLLDLGLLKRGLSAEAFRLARIGAEARARETRAQAKGDREVDLEEIHAGLRGLVKDGVASAALEAALEGELVLVNPVVRSLLDEARAAGKATLLLSDMYLGSARITALLWAAGLDPGACGELLVSSDLKVTKRDGGLFKLVLDRPGAPPPDRILHIGDNPVADGTSPAALGIGTRLYTAITGPAQDLFSREELHAPGVAPELASLRRVLWNQAPGTDPRHRFWHRFGCTVLGPLLDGYAHWIVSTCQAEGISRVVALMRDGHTLGPLLQRAAGARGVALDVVPGWLSRRSVLFGTQPEPSDQSLSAIFQVDTFTVRELFSCLAGVTAPPEVAAWMDLRLAQCAYVRTEDGRDARAHLVALLLSRPFRSSLEAFFSAQRDLLLDYLAQLAGGQTRIAFVDIGFSGTIGRAVHDTLARQGSALEIVHLFGLGHLALGRHLDSGMDARCFAGGYGKDWDLLQRLLRSSVFLEELILGNHGSAKGYARDAQGRSRALRCPPELPMDELQDKAWCQEGIAQWQRAKFEAEGGRQEGSPSPTSLLRLLLRSVALPTAEEALRLGELTHDYGFGGGVRQRLCPESAAALLEAWGPSRFLACTASNFYTCGVPWPEGTVTRAHPLLLLERALRHGDGENGLSNEYLAPALRIFEEQPGPCLIYGASNLGQQALRLLRLLDVPVAGFLDRNPALWGTDLGGVRVHSPESAQALDFQAVMIGSILYAKSIVHDIRSGILGVRPGLALYSPFPDAAGRLEPWDS